ncbi:MAG TPA: ribonuclease III [Verrucomicrobiae bacterium]|nr:ribonuclease III [Verrucomicrobiae bacterium]
MIDFTPLEDRIGYVFRDRDLLQQVFIHRSYLNEHRAFPLDHNERLEFLGDAVLELVVTEHLYKTFPNPEGELTTFRSALVKGETLATIANDLNFSEYLMVSKGEEKSGGKNKAYLLANALEAFIGALHLDGGYEAAEKFIHQCVLNLLENILANKLHIDPKSRLQEYTQEHFGQTPIYDVISETGPDHAKEFSVVVRIGDRELGRGLGASKQAGQVAAAAEALAGLE